MRSRMSLRTMLLLGVALALFLSLPAAALISKVSLWRDAAGEQTGLAQMLVQISQEKNLRAEDLASRDRRGRMRVTVVEEGAAADLAPEQREALMRGESVTRTDAAGNPETFVRIGGGTLRLSGTHSGRTFWRVFFRALMMVAVPVAGLLVLIMLVMRLVMNSIAGLMDASRQVSTGDYGVHLREDLPGEVGQINRAFNRLAEELRVSDIRDSQLLQQVSHELRTPLASIRGYAQLMGMDGLTEQERDAFAGIIADESGRLSRATDRLLRLADLSGHSPAQLQETRCSLDESWRRVLAQETRAGVTAVLSEAWVTADEDLIILTWQCLLEGLPENAPVKVICGAEPVPCVTVTCGAPLEHLQVYPVIRHAAALCHGTAEERGGEEWMLRVCWPSGAEDARQEMRMAHA